MDAFEGVLRLRDGDASQARVDDRARTDDSEPSPETDQQREAVRDDVRGNCAMQHQVMGSFSPLPDPERSQASCLARA